MAPLWFTMHCVMGDRAAVPKGNSKARRMGQDESRGSWFAERKRPLAFAMSLTLYWPLFVLFVFPPELFPEAPAALATCAQTGVVAFVFVLGAVVALAQSGRGERRSALLVAAGRRYTVAVSLVLLAAVVGALLAFRLSDQPAPSVFFWLYPLAMGFYAFSLSLRLASAAQTYLYNRLAMLVAGSLLLSFLVGIALPAVGSALGLVQTDSNFLMLMASGVVALLFPIEREGEGSRSVEEGMQPAAEDIKPSFRTSGLLLLVLWGYLLGSGVFLGIHWAPVNGVWTFDGWIHRAIGFVLFGGVGLCVLLRRRGSDPVPWTAFLPLCIASLYCAALFYPALAAACVEVILPSRPLAMVLLWLASVWWSRDRGIDARWAVATMVLPGIFLVAFMAEAVGFANFSSDDAAFLARGIVLLTAFAITIGMVRWASVRSCHGSERPSVAPAQPCGQESVPADSPAVFGRLAAAHDLTARESQVMALLSEGHTQRRIAELMQVSINSVRTYAKGLYAKLGIHSRQELIDLVNEEGKGEAPSHRRG